MNEEEKRMYEALRQIYLVAKKYNIDVDRVTLRKGWFGVGTTNAYNKLLGIEIDLINIHKND